MNEIILEDRLNKIREVIEKYGEDNFCISFSGGKDSVVLSNLIDMAVPGNNIPRVYADTGIELNMIRDFVIRCAENDNRINIIRPVVPIRQMLEKDGYPFKSKMHAKLCNIFWKHKSLEGRSGIIHYLDGEKWKSENSCPKCLRYQFTNEFLNQNLHISDKCCFRLKEEPLDLWKKEHNKIYGITGIMRSEGGRRIHSQCLAFTKNKLTEFHPMVPLTKQWEDWFIEKYHIEICDIYKPPYNFVRTGCKGCPFAINLKRELDILEKYFPSERKQCEIIWKPVYDEYRRIGYRLK